MNSRIAAVSMIFMSVAIIGCGKDVELGPINGLSPSLDPDRTSQCGEKDWEKWRFIQPAPDVNRSVDLLLVVDASSSLSSERSRIASALPAFMSSLHADSDLRVGVMLGHGGRSSYSGRLYSPSGTPKVISATRGNLAQAQTQLSQTLARNVPDIDEADGEAMFYSIMRGLDPLRVAEMRSLGFLRARAALSVLFISDENDLCFDPERHGYSTFPHFVPSYGGIEKVGYAKYCQNADGSPRFTPEIVRTAIRDFKAPQPVSWGALTHVIPERVPRASEKAIGHGMLELTHQDIDGVTIEITDSDYASSVARLGNVVSEQLRLQTDFPVKSARNIRGETLNVQVDGQRVRAEYDADRSAVRIAAATAGSSGSVIDVTACVD